MAEFERTTLNTRTELLARDVLFNRNYGPIVPVTIDFTVWTTSGGVSAETTSSFSVTSIGGKFSEELTIGTRYLLVMSGVTCDAPSWALKNGASGASPDILTDNGSFEFEATAAQLYFRIGSTGSFTLNVGTITLQEVTSG